MIRFGPADSPPQIWAVEDDRFQITWGDLPAGTVTAKAVDGEASIEHDGGPGGLSLEGLSAATDYEVGLLWPGGSATLTGATLTPPSGELLCRFATVSDLHLGAFRWGALKTMIEQPHHDLPHPYRCAESAVEEAVSWGAELLVIKGDAAQHETASDFAELGRLVDRFEDLPMLLIPGNHDVDGRGGPSDVIPLTVGKRELPYCRSVAHHDLPGLRVIVADTSIPGRGRGTVERVGPQLIELAGASGRPVFIGLHHQLHPHRIPRHWPIGIAADESRRFLDGIAEAADGAMVSCGHSHRNRSRTHRGVLVTEVGSTKDWPGVWAGYAVHEGGIRQVVRRVARHDAIAWTEYSRDAVNGLWGLWSPGPLDQRCLSHTWMPGA